MLSISLVQLRKSSATLDIVDVDLLTSSPDMVSVSFSLPTGLKVLKGAREISLSFRLLNLSL